MGYKIQYIKMDSSKVSKRRPMQNCHKPAFYHLASRERQKWLQKKNNTKNDNPKRSSNFHTFTNYKSFFFLSVEMPALV